MLAVRLFIVTLAALMLTAALSSAQSGSITGKVTDGETGEALRGATIQVTSMKKGAYSDFKGNYRVKSVPVGTHEIRVTYVGYTPKTIGGVVVTETEPAVVNLVLNSSASKSAEIVVTANRVNDNAEALLAQRKKSATVSDAISREEISKFGDSDAGAALSRVTGVTLVDKKFVYVRGVSDRYSNTLLNGSSLSSTEPDKKAFSFDVIPSEFLENAIITKSYSPDLPGNFAGGTVQLNTIDFPQRFALVASVATSYNDNVTFRNSAFRTYSGGSTDWLGTDDGTRAFPANAPADRLAMNELISRAGAPDVDNGAGAREWIALGQAFNDRVWDQSLATAPLNTSYGLSYADIFSTEDVDLGVVAGLNYGNTYSINTINRNGLNGDGTLQFAYAGDQATRGVELGGMVNVSARFSGKHTISVKTIANRSMSDESVFLDGDYIPQVRDRRFYSTQFVQRELLNGQINGEHQLNIGNISLDWRLGASVANRDEPDLRRLRYDRALNDATEAFRASIPPTTPQGDGALAGRFQSGLEDQAYNGALNLTIPVDNVKLKAGFLAERRNRVFSARSFTIVQSRAIIPDVETDVDLTLEPGELLRAENFRGDGFGLSEETRLSDAYSAEEELYAAYALVEFPIEIAGRSLRVNVGARIEDNVQRLNSFDLQNRPAEINLKTTDILPALNLVYGLTKEMNIRVSLSQTLSRPMLREFAPFAFYDFQQQARTQGNPALRRPLIQNYDVRYEYFPTPGGVLSVSGFYKVFTDAIEQTIIPAENIALSYSNANGRAVIFGIELEARNKLDFFGKWADGLFFSTNLTLVNSQLTVQQGGRESTRRMWGQSPYAFNAALSYNLESTGSSINIGYNVFGRRIVRVALDGAYTGSAAADPHVYELPRDVIDLTFTQRITDAIDFRVGISDILNQQLVWEQVGSAVATNLRGRTFSVNFGYRFQ